MSSRDSGQRSFWAHPVLRLLFFAGGCNPDVLLLPECEDERARRALIGLSFCLTVLLAALTGAHAASILYGEGPFELMASLGGAVINAALVGTMDGLLIWTTPKDPEKGSGWSLPVALRYLSAAVIALAMSLLTVLWICRDEIQVQMSMRRFELVQTAREANRGTDTEIGRLKTEKEDLEAELEAAHAETAAREKEMVDEASGSGGTGRRNAPGGANPIYDLKREAYLRAAARERALEAKVKESVAPLERSIERLVAVRDGGIDTVSKQAENGHSLPSQYIALQALKQDKKYGAAVTVIDVGVTVVLVLIEICAVSAKLSGGAYGCYEAEMRRRRRRGVEGIHALTENEVEEVQGLRATERAVQEVTFRDLKREVYGERSSSVFGDTGASQSLQHKARRLLDTYLEDVTKKMGIGGASDADGARQGDADLRRRTERGTRGPRKPGSSPGDGRNVFGDDWEGPTGSGLS